MKRKVKIILMSTVVIILVGIILYSPLENILSPDGTPAAKLGAAMSKTPLQILTKVVEYETLTDDFITIGSTLPDEEVDLSFEMSGKIISINFTEGAPVKKGELLAKINDAPLQAQLKKLQAALPLAKERVERHKTLLIKEAISKESAEEVNTELAELEADIEYIKTQIAQTELHAPFDGVIGLRTVSEGQYVTPQDNMAKLTKNSPIRIEFAINEQQAKDIKNGTQILFKTNSDALYAATVSAIEGKIDNQTRTLTARATYHNSNEEIIPGSSAEVKIQAKAIRNAITAPSEAIITELGQNFVYIYNNGKAKQVKVNKGIRTANKVQILDGLKVGDTLIVNGVMQLKNDMPVEIAIK